MTTYLEWLGPLLVSSALCCFRAFYYLLIYTVSGVRTILKLHNGRTAMISTENTGASFTARIGSKVALFEALRQLETLEARMSEQMSLNDLQDRALKTRFELIVRRNPCLHSC